MEDIKMKGKIDYTALEKYVKYAIKFIKENGGPPKDFDHYVFESAMNCMFDNFWDWYNKLEY